MYGLRFAETRPPGGGRTRRVRNVADRVPSKCQVRIVEVHRATFNGEF